MKAVTGNRLTDGAVVYLADDDQWTVQLSRAVRIGDNDALDALSAAQTRVHEIADAYLIDIAENGAPGGRARIRESIRRAGPTVRPDLARQQETAA